MVFSKVICRPWSVRCMTMMSSEVKEIQVSRYSICLSISEPMFVPFSRNRGCANTFVSMQGYSYNAELPGMCHQYLDGKMSAEVVNGRFTELAAHVSKDIVPANLTDFANSYLNAFNTGFHYAFLTAVVAMLISLAIFVFTKKQLPNPSAKAKATVSKEEAMQDAKEIKQRIMALLAVFGVVIFFWFSFHQNGLTLTMFAKDYTLLGGIFPSVEIFQSINPFLVVFLTPLVIAIFSWLSKKGIEPSTPKKIAIGMGIAALAFVVMALGSLNVPLLNDVKDMGGLPDAQRVTPWLLFFVLLHTHCC